MNAKFFLIFILLTTVCFAEEVIQKEKQKNALATLEGEPTAIVAGCVYALTGQYCESSRDLVIRGIEPLALQRYYGGYYLGDWGINADGQFSKSWENISKPFYKIKNEFGSLLIYSPQTINGKKENRIKPKCLKKGITNCATGLISGKTNIKNNVYLHGELYTGAGEQYSYESGHLKRIKKPNQYTLHYSYADRRNFENQEIIEMAVKNKKGEKISWLKFSYEEPGKYHNWKKITSSDGRELLYKYAEEDKSVIFEIKADHFPKLTYTQKKHRTKNYNTLRLHKELPEGRFLTIDKYDEGEYHLGVYKFRVRGFGDPICEKVMSLQAPVGTDETPITTHRFIYIRDKEGGEYLSNQKYRITAVLDAYNHMTQYSRNRDRRLSMIEHFTGTFPYKFYCQERLYWGENDSKDNTNLICRSFTDEMGTILFCRYFKYDDFGNIISDRIFGNLTGENKEKINLSKKGIPEKNGCECSIRRFSYSKDGLNLMTKESNERNDILYEYVKGTDYLSKKFIVEKGKIKIRNFYEYDELGALTKEIIDDGSSKELQDLTNVTERKIKYIKNEAPAGLPVVIKECYLDLATQTEKRVKKTLISYDSIGQKVQEDHYDCKGIKLYTLTWEYDKHGNVIKEKTPLGKFIIREYDANNNLIFEEGPSNKYCFKHFYDYSNRLIKTEKISQSGRRFSKTFKYDYNSHCTEISDWFGNLTKYELDDFGRIVKIIHPAVCDAKSCIAHPVERYEYDAMGNIVKFVDPMGGVTQTAYTIRNKPSLIHHPDGTVEKFTYSLNGDLLKHQAKNGSITSYTYDFLSRPLKKEIFGSNGELLSSYSYTYNAFHLLSEKDPEGHETKYRYDGAGRLISKEKGEKLTYFEYDNLGRLAVTKEFFGIHSEDFIAKIQEFDFLNRVIEERTQDSRGTLLTRVNYAYDDDGNRIQTVNYTSVGKAITRIHYNSLKEPVEIKDPLGNITRATRNDKFRNALGQNVSYQTQTDPLGNQTLTIKDALNRVVSIEKKNSFGRSLQKVEFGYDLCGRKVRETHSVIGINGPDKSIANLWEYNLAGQLIAIIEAAGTPEQKTTRFSYNEKGQKTKIIKPNGIELINSYDSLGRVSSLSSSDGTLHYSFNYDLNNLIVKVIDEVQKTCTSRSYDSNGNLSQEILANELQLSFSYDRMSRIESILTKDSGKIEYGYVNQYLSEIRRLNPQGDLAYVHRYTSYDSSGQLQLAHLIGKGGQLLIKNDLLGRPKLLESLKWKEVIDTYDPIGNLLKRTVQGIPCEYSYDDLYQLKSETGIASHTYASDSLYNRIQKNNSKHTYNSLNQLLQNEEWEYQYDACGRLVQKKNQDRAIFFKYDPLDRLIEVQEGSKRSCFTYDFDNRRMSKICFTGTEEASTTLYLYQGLNEIGSANGSKKIKELRILGLGKGAEIGAAVALELDGKVYAPLHDHNGNVSALLDMQGQLEETYHYSAFGEEQILDQNGNRIDDSINPWRFSSKRIDPETGLIHFGRRYYDPEIGRWMTPDPLGFEGGPNLYAYVVNNPLTHFDLYGLLDAATTIESGSRSDRFLDRVRRGIGHLCRALGDHLLPIPVIRDFVSCIGHRLEGGSPNDFYKVCRNPHSHVGHLHKPELYPNHQVALIGGVLNRPDENIEKAEYISQQFGGTNVHYMYNSSHGLLLDVMESIVQKLGFRTHSIDKTVTFLRERLKAVGQGGTLTLLLHSQSGIIGDRSFGYLTFEEKKMLHIITFGTAKIIDSSDLGKAVNYISRRDPIPWIADPFGCLHAAIKRPDHVKFVASNGIPFADHPILSETYRNLIKDESKNYLQLCGVENVL